MDVVGLYTSTAPVSFCGVENEKFSIDSLQETLYYPGDAQIYNS